MYVSINGLDLLPKTFHDFYSQDHFSDLKLVVKLDDSNETISSQVPESVINDVTVTSGAYAENESLHDSQLDPTRWSNLREGSNLNETGMSNESAITELPLPIAESSRANTTDSTIRFWEKSCHQIILAHNSPLMKAILIKAWNELETETAEQNAEASGELYHAKMDRHEGRRFLRLELKDVSASSLEAILGFIYTGELRIEAENFGNLVQDAKKLEFSSIVQLCEKHLTQTVDLSNCEAILLCAYHADDEKAINKCFNFIMMQFFQSYSNSSNSDVQLCFLEFTYPILLRLVESDFVNEAYAQTVVELIVAWVDADRENRSQNMFSLIQPKVQLLSIDFLFELGRNEVIGGDDPTFKLVMKTYLSKKSRSPSTPSSSSSLSPSCSSSKNGNVVPNIPQKKQTAGDVLTPSATALPTHAVTSIERCLHFESTQSASNSPNPKRPQQIQSNDETLLLFSNAGFEIFDRANDSWTKCERKLVSNNQWICWDVQLVGDKLIFMGWLSDQEGQTRLYDLTTGIWTSGLEKNSRNIWPTASCVVNGDTILAVGWIEADIDSLLCETLQIPQDMSNFSDCQWKQLPGSTPYRLGYSVASVNNQAFVMGGHFSGRVLSSVKMFDFRSLQWKRVRDMIEPRMAFTTATYKDMIYVFGGSNDFYPLSTCERYDPSIDMWTPISNLPSPIGHGAAGLLGNRITVICNTNLEDKQGNSTFVYDIETDKWFQGSRTVFNHSLPRCFTVKKSHLSSISTKKLASLSLETI